MVELQLRGRDIVDEAVLRVRRQPLKAIVMAAGVGLTVGVVAAWITARLAQRPTRDC